MISLVPGPATGFALAFALLIGPVLALLSHGALRIDSERARFLAAVGLCVFAWVACVMAFAGGGSPASWHDALAGFLILATATIAFGILWSLLCWGFTTSLLAALCAAPRAMDRAEWFRAYGGGSSIEEFADDRLSVLLGSGMAESHEGVVRLSGPLARSTAGVVRAMRSLYGLPAHE